MCKYCSDHPVLMIVSYTTSHPKWQNDTYFARDHVDSEHFWWAFSHRFIQSVHNASVEDPEDVLRIQIDVYHVLQSCAGPFLLEGPARIRN